jgi:hypothetical protein
VRYSSCGDKAYFMPRAGRQSASRVNILTVVDCGGVFSTELLQPEKTPENAGKESDGKPIDKMGMPRRIPDRTAFLYPKSGQIV